MSKKPTYEELEKKIQEFELIKISKNQAEEKYRLLFENMMNGFALHKIVLNQKKIPIDYKFIEVNKVFEEQTGLKKEVILGKNITEVIPGIKNDSTDWIGMYGKVALTGEETSFEQFSETLSKWYQVLAYSPNKGYFATIFMDITEHKQAEQVLKKEQNALEAQVSKRTKALAKANEELRIEINDRKKAEKKLRERDEYFRAVFQTAKDAIISLDHLGTIIFWNNGAQNIFGYQAEEIVGKSCSRIMPERFRSMHEKGIKNYNLETGSMLSHDTHELVGLHKNGSEFFVELTLANWSVDQKWFFTGIVRDISDRKELEDDVKQYTHHLKERVKELKCLYGISNLIESDISVKQFFQKTVELIPPSWQYPEITHARITFEDKVYTNKSFCESNWVQKWPIMVHGKENGFVEVFYSDNKNQFVDDPFLTEEYDLIKAICQRLGETIERKIAERNLKLVHENLEDMVKKRTIELARKHEELIKETNDRLEAYKAKDKLEAQLRQSQKMESIGTLAGGIAHDFNNILSAVIGYTELTMSDLPKEDRKNRNLHQVLKAAHRAKELVQQILTFSRKNDQELKPLRIQKITMEVIKLLRSTIPSTIEIQHDIDRNCQNVLADPTQIHQVIMNLCTNAYHAMKKSGGLLTISLKQIKLCKEDINEKLKLKSGAYLKLEICDTGTGINKINQDKIFEPYYTTKAQGEGTGLGLAVVHGITNSLNGDITLRSSSGKGTIFQVYLPVAEENEHFNQIENLKPVPRGNERILFIDDDKDITEMSQLLLTNLGYTVTALIDSSEALEVFKKSKDEFDIVITDMTMPKMTGVELAEQIFATRPEMPIILCSGFSELINERKSLEMGISKYLPKPIEAMALSEAIRDILDRKRC